MTLRSNPDQRLAPCTPMRSCLHSLIRPAKNALLDTFEPFKRPQLVSAPTNFITISPVHPPTLTYTGPHTLFKPHSSQPDHRIRRTAPSFSSPNRKRLGSEPRGSPRIMPEALPM